MKGAARRAGGKSAGKDPDTKTNGTRFFPSICAISYVFPLVTSTSKNAKSNGSSKIFFGARDGRLFDHDSRHCGGDDRLQIQGGEGFVLDNQDSLHRTLQW